MYGKIYGSGKDSLRNNLYRVGNNDANDVGFSGIKVSLKEYQRTDAEGKMVGNEIATTTTSELGKYNEIYGGEYLFTDVEISKLSNYYIEYEYNGLKYKSVIVNTSAQNGSKATDEIETNIMDKKFARVDSTGNNEVSIKNSNSTEITKLGYGQTQNNVATPNFESNSITTVHANTKDTNYKISYTNDDYKNGVTEIRNINLGLYQKEQADLSLTQDLENINVGVNGYWHIYKYAKRNLSDSGYNKNDKNTWNVGVKFKNSYTGTYRRAIYKADYEYEKADDRDKELKMYLTYKIAITNESSYLTKVNNIVDYFDNRYTLIGVGTGLDTQNNITGNINVQAIEKYKDNYQKCIINTNTIINSGESNYIYIQFRVERSGILSIMNNNELMINRAEINSYTVYKDNNGNTVAAIDRDSVPGNAKIENINTFEDDTDSAPAIQLELKDDRKITGTVFVDSTTGELKTGEIRQGNGQFDNGENTIAGVKVT